jgi:hypothetical protein
VTASAPEHRVCIWRSSGLCHRCKKYKKEKGNQGMHPEK